MSFLFRFYPKVSVNFFRISTYNCSSQIISTQIEYILIMIYHMYTLYKTKN